MEGIKSNTAIITAAGSGLRLPGATKKQYRELAGIPILIRSMEPFILSPLVDNIIVTSPEDDITLCEAMIQQYYADYDKPILVIAGGGERQDSVFGALQRCPEQTDFVFIHDGVRPFVTLDLLEELYQLAVEEGSAIPAAKLKHTIKEVEGQYAVTTLDRGSLIQVFTPQVFAYPLIMDAYLQAYTAGYVGTDDASLVELTGSKVRYMLSSELNLKITDEIDMFYANQIIIKNMI